MYYQADPVHQDPNTGAWWFYTPDLQSRYGPYPDPTTAYQQVNEFVVWLNSQGSQPAAPQGQAALDQLVVDYIALRDELEEIKARHKEELAEPQRAMEQAEALMMDFMNKNGMQSFSSGPATVYTHVSTRCNVGDKTALLDHIKQTGDFDLLQNRINSTNVKQWLDQHPGQQLPGVSVEYVREVRVRRK